MLTKDLLRFKVLSGYVRPSFIDTADKHLLDFAGLLLETYRAGTGSMHSEVTENVAPRVQAAKDLKLTRGIVKTLEDACTFSGGVETDCAGLRRELFGVSAMRLRSAGASGEKESMDSFRSSVFAEAPQPCAMLHDNIYCDLPDYEVLSAMPADWTPPTLLERYNCSLAQSLVIYASSLDCTVIDGDPAKMRRLFKYLRFFGLLVSVEKSGGWADGVPSEVKMHIDGPASLLDNGVRYGLRLASFLPALFQFDKWKLACRLKMRDREMKFNLDDSAGLSRRFGNISAYIPEEVGMFARLFAEKVPEWKIDRDTPFLRTSGQDFIFPDFTFTDGVNTVHLELFHKWHAFQLAARLEFLEKNPEFPLVIGIDRGVYPAKSRPEDLLEKNPLYGRKIFLFRDFPGVDRVRSILDACSGTEAPGLL